MDLEAKTYRSDRRRDPVPSLADRCSKLTIKASNEAEASLLALLSRVLTDTLTSKHSGNRVRLYAWLRDQVPDKYAFDMVGVKDHTYIAASTVEPVDSIVSEQEKIA